MNTKEQFIKYSKKLSTIEHGKDGPTPISLVEEMLDKLPIDWSNPNLKILEPCFGFGTFLYFAYLRLLKYHDETHILDNMLYGIEMEPFRYQLTKNILKFKNLYLGDTLNPTNKLEEILNMKFDVILGNPPYENSKHKAKKDSLWKKFILKSDGLLNKNGILTFVIPASFTSPTKLFNGLKNRLSYIDLTPKKYFKGVGSTFCYIILNKDIQKKCKITSNQGKVTVNLDEFNSIPSQISKEILEISKKVFKGERKWNLSTEYHTQTFSDFIDNGKYEVIHSTVTKRTNTLHDNNKKIRVHISVTNNTKFDVCVNKGLTQNHIWTEFDKRIRRCSKNTKLI